MIKVNSNQAAKCNNIKKFQEISFGLIISVFSEPGPDHEMKLRAPYRKHTYLKMRGNFGANR